MRIRNFALGTAHSMKKQSTFRRITALGFGISIGLLGAGEISRARVDHRIKVQETELQKLKYEIDHFEGLKAREYRFEIESLRKKPFSQFEGYYNKVSRESDKLDRAIQKLKKKTQVIPEEKKELEQYLLLRRLMDSKLDILQKEWAIRKPERFKELQRTPKEAVQ